MDKALNFDRIVSFFGRSLRRRVFNFYQLKYVMILSFPMKICVLQDTSTLYISFCFHSKTVLLD